MQFMAQLPMSTIQAGDVSAATAVAAVRQAMERQAAPMRAGGARAGSAGDAHRDLLATSRSILNEFAQAADVASAAPPRGAAVRP